MLLPCIGGFNDGKFIEPKGREFLKMAIPSDLNASCANNSHAAKYKDHGFDFKYEVYILRYFKYEDGSFPAFVHDSITMSQALKLLIFGYKQFNKEKSLK